MAEYHSLVEDHYTRRDLGEVILAALKAAGKDIDHLTPDDLAPVDEFHGGQRPATVRLRSLACRTSGTSNVASLMGTTKCKSPLREAIFFPTLGG